MIGLCRTDEMANNLKLNYWETLKFTNLQKYIKFLSLFSTKSRFCQIQVEYLLNKVSTYKVYVEECIQTFIGKYTVHTNGFQSSMYKFVFKNRLNLSKRNLKFELKRNFDFVEFCWILWPSLTQKSSTRKQEIMTRKYWTTKKC